MIHTFLSNAWPYWRLLIEAVGWFSTAFSLFMFLAGAVERIKYKITEGATRHDRRREV